MPEIRMWWQAADEPYHCRPDDPAFSLDPPPEDGSPRALTARPGQNAAIQLMLESDCDTAVKSVAFEPVWQAIVPALGGVDRFGKPFQKVMPLAAGRPWPLWMLIKTPMTASGEHRIECRVELLDGSRHTLPLSLNLCGDPVWRGGEDDMDTLARLSWLASATGCEDTVTAPYLPVAVCGNRVSILGRDIEIGADGLPDRMLTRFTGINDALLDEGTDIFAAPAKLEAVRNGAPVALTGSCRIVSATATRAAWRAELSGGGLALEIDGSAEFDGWMHFEARWTADSVVALDDIRLVLKPTRAFARWFSGVGTMAVEYPETHRWRWDRQKHQDGFFCGGMNGGVVVRPLDENYVRPYCNIYYKFGPRNQPKAWVNGGEGHFALDRRDGYTELAYHTGPLTVKIGESVRTDFDIGFTPFKLVSQAAHYGVRYYQAPGETSPDEWIATAKRICATHVNVHHAKEIYPFINYPMYDGPAMRDFAAAAHAAGLKMKPYYTVRELTSKLPEFFPLRSLGAEIFAMPKFNFGGVPGQGDKDEWLREECGNDVLPAWKAVFTKGKYAGTCDPSVIVNPASRIVNFYIEGLRWMCENFGIDGIYVDDTGLDRHALRRARRVLDGRRPGAKIDLHSWNHFHDEYGESWGHNAVMYAELFPYVDSLWFGEGFDFNEISPTEMLVECSGLPFGLMSEMLEGGGNPWRGLLFGETRRAGWQQKGPEGVWAMRAAYGFDRAKMRGWWEENPPAKADDPRVLVTLYELPEGAMLCAASFAESPVSVTFDLSNLGFQPVSAHLPEIANVQKKAAARPDQAFEIGPREGVVIFLQKGTCA